MVRKCPIMFSMSQVFIVLNIYSPVLLVRNIAIIVIISRSNRTLALLMTKATVNVMHGCELYTVLIIAKMTDADRTIRTEHSVDYSNSNC